MPYGYLGVHPNQQKSNSGVFAISDYVNTQNDGELGGSLELIATETVGSATATVDFTSIKQGKYDVHFVTFHNIQCETDGKRLVMRFFESGNIEAAGVYHYATQVSYAGAIYSSVNATSGTDIRISDNTGNDTGESQNGFVYCYNLGDSNKYSVITSNSSGVASTSIGWGEFGGGALPQASEVDGIRFLIDGNHNITGGVFKLYGVKQI